MLNQQALWKMKNLCIQLRAIQSLPFYVKAIQIKTILLTQVSRIRPRFVDHSGIETSTPQQIAELKKSRSKTCGLWGHWHSDHTPDGTLKPGVKASKNPRSQPFNESGKFSSKPHPYKKRMTFTMIKFNDKSSFSPAISLASYKMMVLHTVFWG